MVPADVVQQLIELTREIEAALKSGDYERARSLVAEREKQINVLIQDRADLDPQVTAALVEVQQSVVATAVEQRARAARGLKHLRQAQRVHSAYSRHADAGPRTEAYSARGPAPAEPPSRPLQQR